MIRFITTHSFSAQTWETGAVKADQEKKFKAHQERGSESGDLLRKLLEFNEVILLF